MTSPSVFISYSHKDEEWKNFLVTHLGVLEQEGILDIWDDRRISAGDDWKPEIEKAINNATVAILMISANFLTSKFILSEEVPKLLERREREGVRVIPIIVKPCAWMRVKWLSNLQAYPKDGKALSAGNENQIDMDLASFADEIANLIDGIESSATKKQLSTNISDKVGNKSSEIQQETVHTLAQRIQHLIDFGEYEKAINECSSFLDDSSEEPLINLLIVIATLKGKGADRYQTRTIKRLEKYLSNACDDPNFYPTALVVWGLIKHDHYKLNNFLQEKPTLSEIKDALVTIDYEKIDLNLIEKIKASQMAYNYLDLSRFFPG